MRVTEELLSVSHLSAAYGGIVALRDVSVSLGERSLVCVIGSNGAGKSTLINCISGVLRPIAGVVTYRGRRITGMKVERIASLRIMQVPEGRRVLGPLSVVDNLLLGGTVAGLRGRRERASLDRVYGLFPRLAERARQPAGSLSGGEQQMLALGRALMGDPAVLLLDEPSLGLAPIAIAEVYRALTELRKEGLSMLLVEQNARLALEVSDFGYVLQRGCVVAENVSSALLDESQLVRAYLGFEGGEEEGR